ncbi:MAG: hypothetical protein Q9192_006199, partial [Flavoplaca navasiana]
LTPTAARLPQDCLHVRRRYHSLPSSSPTLPPTTTPSPLLPYPRAHLLSSTNTGATYDAIEGRFRIIKKEAAKLLAEVSSGERPPAPARGASTATSKNSSFLASGSDAENITPKKTRNPRSTTSTPRAKKSSTSASANGMGSEKVLGGRVSKSPKKKTETGVVVNGIKEEVAGNEESMQELLDMGMDVESVVEGLGLDANASYEGAFGMEI